MPNMFGGSNSDKDYAPHMWIGDHFVGSTIEVKVGDVVYKTGCADIGPVAVCRPVSSSTYSPTVLMGTDVPPEVASAARREKNRRDREIADVKRSFRQFNDSAMR